LAWRVGGVALAVLGGWPGAMVLAAWLAWAIGRGCRRLRSEYLAIATIGVAEIIRLAARSEDWLTGGVRGISGIRRPFGELPYFASQLAYLALVAAAVLLAYVLVERQLRSPWGRMMRAIRDDEAPAAASGTHVEC